jgi:acid stress-induced BolA-like protein IbaG/YrbA
MLDPNEIRRRIQESLPGSEVEVKDLTGTGDHFEARVVSPDFAGKSMVDQHKLVYAPLNDLLKTGELHALALKTYSPEQWKKLSARSHPL